jgi:hypothetical protein
MLETIATLMLMALLADQGKANDQVQQAVRRALFVGPPRWTFHVVFTRQIWHDAIYIANLVPGKHPRHEAGGGYRSEDDAFADIRDFLRDGREQDVQRAALVQLYEEVEENIDPEVVNDWRRDLGAHFDWWDSWVYRDRGPQGLDYFLGATVTLNPPDQIPEDPVQWFVEQMMRLYGDEESGHGPVLAWIGGEGFDLVGYDIGTRQLDPRLTDQEAGYIEARDLLDQPLTRSFRDAEERRLFHKDIWDQLIDDSEGRIVSRQLS